MFNYHAKRARLARVSVLLDKKYLRLFLWLITVASSILWIYLVPVMQNQVGQLVLLLLTPVSMALFWYHGGLKHLSPEKNKTVEGALERDVLGRLSSKPSLHQLAEVASKSNGGRFFMARFALSADFIAKLLEGSNVSVDEVWHKTIELSEECGEKTISGASLFAALVLLLPRADYYLAQLKLDESDVKAGLKWHEHIRKVIAHHRAKRYHGGIGRDLSFGWAPLLNQVGFNLTENIAAGGLLHREIEGHEDALKQMIHLLSQPGKRNAVLVGPVGVGKTTLVDALAQRLLENRNLAGDLKYHQVISLDAASLIAQAQGRGALESLIIRLFNEAVHAKNIIIFLDEAQLFLQEGTGSVDLSNILLPVLEGGGLRIILAMSDQQWVQLSQVNPGLTQLMNRVVVGPLREEDTMRVIEDQVLLLEAKNQVTYMYQSLQEAYRLSDRFIRDQEFPGKAIKLLEAAAGFTEAEHFITEKSVQQATEKSFDVKVQTASSTEEKDTLLNLEGKIHERMINQTRAVKVVSDALRRARVGVRNQNKPIGTFLFLGPTGVGKTELAKALAAVYFNGEDKLVRVDLNEFSGPNDVDRLLAVGGSEGFSLAAQIAKQPFSVVLLDEIEKAHPNVLNVLLQMLDEGILRDSANQQVSFRDAIIIATSNAGAEKIREHIESGENLEQFEDAFMDELINSNIFRAEFINRFDEVVLFKPLEKQELLQVLDLIVASINQTLAPQKVSVALTEAAKNVLIEAGYDPRLGARPLRRVTQRSIENVVAQKLLQSEVTPGMVMQLDAPEIQAALSK